MSHWHDLDPEAAREAAKYDNPIPSRELILALLSDRGAPANRQQLAEELKVETSDQLEALRRRLRAMERDGQLIYTRKGSYVPVDKLDLVLGRVSGHRDGFGFLIPDEGDDLFLSPAQMRLVFDGDKVLARVAGVDRRGRREGSIVEVTSRAHDLVVGRYCEENGIHFVVPDNPKLQQDILLSGEDVQASGAKLGQFVSVSITHWPTRRLQARGEIRELVGDYMAPGMEVDIALRSYSIPYVWPESVELEIKSLTSTVAESDKKKRVDLRALAFVTIDGDDARDFDDAVYCESIDGTQEQPSASWKLCVAIADVSHYVNVGSALDAEALLRGNSVYFPERVIPMLPEILSNGLCSLKPKTDRLAMVCEMLVSAQGEVLSYQFYEAVIYSHARLTYSNVALMLEDEASGQRNELRLSYATVFPHLIQLKALYDAFVKARKIRGAIDFDTQDTHIIFDAEQKISEIRLAQRNVAHKIIEECMLAANVATASFLQEHKLPALYRVHDEPAVERLEKLKAFLSELGLSLYKGKNTDTPSPKEYQKLLASIVDRPDKHLIQTVMLRSLSQAVYSADNQGHFGLNYEAYTHFTSPIRRYPDLLVHRAIRSVIRSRRASVAVKRVGAGIMAKAKVYPYKLPELELLGASCSQTERRADEATRDVTNWLKCEFMKSRVGDNFSGLITAVTGFGFFVELSDIYVEGLVHITGLPSDYYHFDAISHSLVGEHTKMRFRLGDTVRVCVMRVDLDERKIDFELDTSSSKTSVRKVSKSNRSTNKTKISTKKKVDSNKQTKQVVKTKTTVNLKNKKTKELAASQAMPTRDSETKKVKKRRRIRTKKVKT